jgi:hypothetical protein
MSAFYHETNGHNGVSPKQQRNGNGAYPHKNSGDEYMMPEEEWERESVLDPAWERQQKKVTRLLSFEKKRACSAVCRHLLPGVTPIYVKLKLPLRISRKIFRTV